MRKFSLSLILFLMLCWLLPLFAAETITGKVVSVADGDTITVLEGRTQVKVRLYGVDAPEKAQDFGTVARTFASDQCFGKEVVVEVADTDRYGRKVGIVTLPDGTVLNHALVGAGLAHWYEEYAPKDATLKRLQEEAKAAKRGLWSRADAVAPWEFRKRERAARVAPRPSPEVKESPVTVVSGDTVYVTESGKKYHRHSCRTLKKSKRSIATGEAKAQGYTPCGICFKR